MTNAPNFYVFTGAPVIGYEQSWVVLSFIGTHDVPAFEQFLITPGRRPLVSREVYRHLGFPAIDAWEQQIREATLALDGIRMELRTRESDLPRQSPVEPIEQRALLQLWLQETHRSAIEYIFKTTASENLREYLRK